MTDDLQKVMDLWTHTKQYNDLEAKQSLTLMAETDEEILYSSKDDQLDWFLVTKGITEKLARKLWHKDAQKWYEDNNLTDVSPFHEAA